MNNAEDIVEFFVENKKLQITKLKNNQDIIAKDKWCCNQQNLVLKDQKCKNCSLVTKLIKDENFINQVQIQINKGEYKNKTYILKIFKDNNLAKYDNKKICKKISNNIIKVLYFYLKDENFFLKEVDFFTTYNKYKNLASINNFVDEILINKNLINEYTNLYNYDCKDNYIFLEKVFEYKNLEELCENDMICKSNIIKNKNIFSIILQIYYYLEILSSYYFCHNDFDINHLRFSSELTKIEIEGKTYTSFVKVYVLPSYNSNISIYNDETKRWKRYFFTECGEKIKQISLPIESFFFSQNGSMSTQDKKSKKILFYKIGKYKENFIKYKRHYGVPLMVRSFDIVCILASLYVEKKLKDYIKNLFLWKKIWRLDELSKICKDLDNVKYNNFENIYPILCKYYIRIDAIYFVRDSLSLISYS